MQEHDKTHDTEGVSAKPFLRNLAASLAQHVKGHLHNKAIEI